MSSVHTPATATMRGAVVMAFGGPEHISIREDLPVPTITESHQVLIEVRAAGVNPVDTYIRAGTFPQRPQLPFVTGIDGAGVVREVGSAVTHVKLGDRVWFFTLGGATAEFAVVPYAFPLPKGFSFTEGACLGLPYSTAYRALFTKGHIKAGERVLIHGASGGVGLAACQLAAFAGASLVVGTAGTEQGLEAVRRNGAHHAVNHRDAGYVQQLKQLAPEGFDLIIEMAAGVNLSTDIDLLARGGRVGIVGRQAPGTMDAGALNQKELTAFGVVAHGATREEHFACADTIDRCFASTGYRPVLNKTYPLEETAQCQKDLMNKNLTTIGKRVIVISE